MGKDLGGVLEREPGGMLFAETAQSQLSGLGFFVRVLSLALLPWVSFGVLYVGALGCLYWLEQGKPLSDILIHLSRVGVRELAIGGVVASLSGIVLGLTSIYLSGLFLIGFFVMSLAEHLESFPLMLGVGLMLLLIVRFSISQLVDSIRRRLEALGVSWVFSEAEAIQIALLSTIPLVGTYHLFLLLVEGRVAQSDITPLTAGDD